MVAMAVMVVIEMVLAATVAAAAATTVQNKPRLIHSMLIE